MTPELFELLDRYGLPGWAAVLIGGGTIVAALITAVSALMAATINAWSAKCVAIYAAHREHRATMTAEVVTRVRDIATLAMHVRDARIRTHDELAEQTGPWLAVARQLKPPVSPFVPDRTVSRAWKLMRRRFVDLGAAFRLGTRGDLESALDKASRLRRAANRLLVGCAAVEFAVEGYVFEIRRSRVRARWILRRVQMSDSVVTTLSRLRASRLHRLGQYH